MFHVWGEPAISRAFAHRPGAWSDPGALSRVGDAAALRRPRAADGVGPGAYPPRMDLVITGDTRDEDGREVGAELWRVTFAGWGEVHRLTATGWCRPRRFAVIDGRIVRAADRTDDPTVLPGEVFTLRVEAPSA